MQRPSSVWWRSNQGVGLALTGALALLLVYLLLSDWVHQDLRDGFKLGFFPVVGVLAMMACTIMLALDSHRREVEEGMEAVDGRAWAVCAAVLLGCYVYFELSRVLGYLLATPIFLFLLTYLFGVRPWAAAVGVSVLMTLVVYALFTVLGVSLPTGFLPY